jgi:hypothetical protein
MKKPASAGSNAVTPYIEREYRFDYTKARPNRFAGRREAGSVLIELAPDVAKVFQDAESVNAALHSILNALPPGNTVG